MVSLVSPEVLPPSRTRRRTAGKVERRREHILERLSEGRRTAIDDLARELDTSPPTLRRDIRQLQREGLLRRERGVVTLAESFAFEPFLDDPGFRDQIRHMASEKRRIGLAAAAMVEDGETIGIAPGTTAAQLTRALRKKRNLTIVTNALNVAMELSRIKDFTVHLTGGYLRGDWFAMVGPRALGFVQTMFPDKFFFGANGIHAERGVTDHHTEEAAVNEAMARQARKRILIADHSKFGQVASCIVCPIRDVDIIVTDAGAGDEVIAPFAALGIQVLRV
jgi:DeoR family transcriptional regulator of aga operon